MAAAAAVSAAAVLIVDLFTSLDVAGGVPYVAVVLLGWWLPSSFWLFGIVAVCSTFTMLGFVLSPVGADQGQTLTERAFVLAAIWLTAVVLALAKKGQAGHVEARDTLERKVADGARAAAKADSALEAAIARRSVAEEALQHSEARLRAVLDTAVEAIVIIDAFGIVQDCNPACRRLFGFRADELIGRNVKMLMGPPYRQEHDDYLRRYCEGGAPKIIGMGRELVAKRNDGTVVPIHLSVGEMRHGGDRYFVGVIRDLTERSEMEQAERELRQQIAQAQKIDTFGNLASGIAHDFNNALFPIIGLTELTVARLPEGSEEQTNLLKALEAAHHAQDLVRQILAFSRREPQDRRPEDLREIVREAIKFLRAGLPSTIEVRERLGETGGLVLADATQIRQVIINLATNARDAMIDAGGLLEVRISRVDVGPRTLPDLEPGRYFRVDVADSGSGMDEATIKRVFEPFFTTKPVNEGHGLGLSVAYGIVKSHKGALTLVSEPGKGTLCSVYLPEMPGRHGKPES